MCWCVDELMSWWVDVLISWCVDELMSWWVDKLLCRRLAAGESTEDRYGPKAHECLKGFLVSPSSSEIWSGTGKCLFRISRAFGQMSKVSSREVELKTPFRFEPPWPRSANLMKILIRKSIAWLVNFILLPFTLSKNEGNFGLKMFFLFIETCW